MAEDAKTYVFDSASKTTDPATLLAMMNNGGGFGGNNWLWVIFLFFLYGWGGNGFFGRNGEGNGALSRDFDTSTLLNAISGNGNAISNLATSLNCSIGQVQTAINGVQSSLASVGNQVGMSGMQVINAIQSGNQTLASQMATCCCENKQLVITQGYENRIANLEQTNVLGSKIDNGSASISNQLATQTTFLSDKFCDLEKRELQNKIDSLRETNSTLQNTISNAQQTAAIQSYVANVVNPIAADVAAIKAAQPTTVSVQWPQLTVVPNYLANNGFSYYSNGLWA